MGNPETTVLNNLQPPTCAVSQGTSPHQTLRLHATLGQANMLEQLDLEQFLPHPDQLLIGSRFPVP